jgi:hypothetical protein
MNPTRISEYPGGGLRCTLCARIIDGTESEYEFTSADGGTSVGLRIHSTCYEAWRLECAAQCQTCESDPPPAGFALPGNLRRASGNPGRNATRDRAGSA